MFAFHWLQLQLSSLLTLFHFVTACLSRTYEAHNEALVGITLCRRGIRSFRKGRRWALTV